MVLARNIVAFRISDFFQDCLMIRDIVRILGWSFSIGDVHPGEIYPILWVNV